MILSGTKVPATYAANKTIATISKITVKRHFRMKNVHKLQTVILYREAV